MGGSNSFSSMPPSKGTAREIKKDKQIDGIGSNNPCINIYEEVRVISPSPNVLSTLNVKDILDVESSNGNAPIILVTNNGDKLGSIIPSSIQILLECLNDGNRFIAEIKSINRGICIVTIKIR